MTEDARNEEAVALAKEAAGRPEDPSAPGKFALSTIIVLCGWPYRGRYLAGVVLDR